MVPFGAGESARLPCRVVGREASQRSLPEEEDVLAIERHVRVGGKEAGAEERVGSVGGLLPQEVRERHEPDVGGRHERLRRVRPEPKLAVDRAERVPDVDREDPPRDEDAIALIPGVGEHPVHPRVIHGSERTEETVPLRDHRVRRGGEDEMDGSVRDPGHSAGIAVNEPDRPSGRVPHTGRKPWHG